ncbi:sigma-54 interaction domain-containing protein [Desulfocurvibacter africanus]|uniref:sigma-54 interaction domain-containing protein n=1 Tax=Desulfocurvibacter africanus TaxID=873 RepID=UPI0004008320|nr:sigma-54-dependent Fis family transcriptional regulator [Desulfocurvibacter africanus]
MRGMSEHELNKFVGKILNTMNDGFFLVSPDGRIAMVNDALCRLLGYERDDLLGKPCTVLKCDVCAKSRAEGGEHWCRLFDATEETRKQCCLVRKDGGLVKVLKNASVLRDGERIVGGVETITDVTELCKREETIQDLKRILDADDTFMGMVGRSAAMQRTFTLLDKAAQSDAPVLLLGESGTGKELAARAIHELGPRKEGPFIQLNCAALNESLLESELFGHAKGAFTGAYRHRQGRFEAADNGDFFLDEVGDVPLPTQVKLLRVLETKSFERVGDHKPITADARIISATNRNLEDMVRRGEFREDLYFRIAVIPIRLPPLRERREDIPLLTEAFIRKLNDKSSQKVAGLSPEAMQLFVSHDWPGNVRELKSALEYAFVVADHEIIRPEHLPPAVSRENVCATRAVDRGPDTLGPQHAAASGGRHEPLEVVQGEEPAEKAALVEALRKAGGNKSETARILGINRVTVMNRMRKYGVEMKKVLSS